MDEKLVKQTEARIEEIVNQGINANNLGNLYRLVKIKHMIKEEENMRYNEYGNSYGRDGYGRRGYDARYRGHDYIERMSDNYGRYEAGREEYGRGGSYGAKEDSMKALELMLESVCDFMNMLERNAETPDERALVKRYAKKLSEM